MAPGSHKGRLPTESQGSCTVTQASHINHNYWYLPSTEGIWQSQEWAQCLWTRWPLKKLSRKPYIYIKYVWEDKYKPEISSASPSFARSSIPWDSTPFSLTWEQINLQNYININRMETAGFLLASSNRKQHYKWVGFGFFFLNGR